MRGREDQTGRVDATGRPTVALQRGRRRFTACSASAFSRRRFADEVIALAVRWYVRYRLSYADVVKWLAERDAEVNRSTFYRWVRRFLPLFGTAARAHRRQVARGRVVLQAQW